jgi:hypothetical protein
MSKTALFMLFAVLLSCGGRALDEDGLASSETALEQFARAGQLYFRGRLSSSLDEFNGVIYRFPDSPLAGDARLAVRRIESDLSADGPNGNLTTIHSTLSSRIAVVGRPASGMAVTTAAGLLRRTGATVTVLTDQQAPELTVVFHADGFQVDACVVADSLHRWLLRPENINCRPGAELIDAVAPGFDVLVIIGNDAVFEPSVN